MNTLVQKIINIEKLNVWSFVFVVLLAILVATVIQTINGRRTRVLANRIPGPNTSFLYVLSIILIDGPDEFLKYIIRSYRQYEKTLYKFWVCNNLYIVLTRPEDIELVLTNPKLQKKSKEYAVLQESIMGQGIFTIEDIKKWKHNRKMVSGGFSFTIIKSFVSIFYEEAIVLNEILQTKCNSTSKECDISVPINMGTMEMIGRTALGVQFNAQKGGRHRFVENFHTALSAWQYRMMYPWYLNKTLFRFSKMKRKHDRSQEIINEFTDEIIAKKLRDLNQSRDDAKTTETDADEDVWRKKQTFIEILLGNHQNMSHEQIRDELVTVIIGGQETTAMANACAIFMLALHQDVQNKVYEELESIFSVGDYTRAPTYEDLQQMEYLERVIKETLRLFPPLPVIGRNLDENIKIGEYLCPAGATLIISPVLVQSSPLYYTDPKKFDPDNFLPDLCRSRHPYAHIPFSAGYRNCIGIKYGMLQMKTVISTLVRNNAFFPSQKCPTRERLRTMFLTTLKFVNGCHVKIVPRAKSQ